jgi:hypothetical protein
MCDQLVRLGFHLRLGLQVELDDGAVCGPSAVGARRWRFLCARTATIGAKSIRKRSGWGSRPTSKFGHWWHATRFLQMTYVEACLAIAALRVDSAGLHDN